ncbi:HAD family phosphatase [Candidatus Saccharibacteria bacterium]|nr:HAD family phosphatase [Candidatus Saccharibacteria bacterium]
MYKAIIFDFFDVIHTDHQKAWLAKYGYKREGGFAEASDQLDSGQIDQEIYFQRYAQHSGSTPEKIKQEFKDLSKIDNDIVKLIKKLKSHYKLGLLSNTTTDELRPILDQYDLAPLFNEIIISADVKMTKPEPEIFQLILKRLQVSPHEAIFVDDNPNNVEGANAVGIKGVLHKDFDSLVAQLNNLGVKT